MARARKCPDCHSDLKGRGTTCPCGWESTARRAWTQGQKGPDYDQPHPLVRLVMEGMDPEEALRRWRAGEVDAERQAELRRLSYARTFTSSSAGAEGVDGA